VKWTALGIAMAISVSASAESDDALQLLRAIRPEVKWRRPVVRGEFTRRGTVDSAVLGVSETMIVVTTVVGPVQADSETVSASWRLEENGIEAHCSKRAALAAEPISIPPEFDDGRRRPDGLRGLRLQLPPCATLHLYWNPEARLFNWWQEKP
jgi:hypothetical protein